MRTEKNPSGAASLLAGLTVLYAVLALLGWDSALSHTLGRFLFGSTLVALPLLLLLTGLAAVFQWRLLHTDPSTPPWLPPAISLSGLLLTEALYLGLGEHGTLWPMLLLPVFGSLSLGILAALTVTWVQTQSRPVKRAAAGIAAALLALCLWSWPRTVSSRIDPQFDGTMAFYQNGSMVREVQLADSHTSTIFRFYKLSPTFREQDWTRGDAIAIRLNDDYLLLAPRDGDPCVYAYTGAPADFALTRPKWVIHHRTYCYEDMVCRVPDR